MGKLYSLLLLLLFAAQPSFGDADGSVRAFEESVPYKVNGCDVRVAVGTTDYNQGTGNVGSLYINIDMSKERPSIKYGELKITVKDKKGKAMDVKAYDSETEFMKSEGQQKACFKLDIEIGQKIESIKMKWQNSERTFLFSKGEVRNIYLF